MHDAAKVVGVVGDPPAGLDAALAEAGADRLAGDAESVLAGDPDLVVATGAAACRAVARAAPDAPLLAVDAGPGFRSVPVDAAADAVAGALDGPTNTESLSLLRVERDGEVVGRAVADVTLVSAEVAHISEFELRSAGDRVSQFRADGVVVATPAGSTGYARRVDGPTVAPGTGVAAVVPIAPFAINPDHWVLPTADDLVVTVARDETPVTLLVDDRAVATVTADEPVSIGADGRARVAVVPESAGRYDP